MDLARSIVVLLFAGAGAPTHLWLSAEQNHSATARPEPKVAQEHPAEESPPESKVCGPTCKPSAC